jgi:cyclophilin family peptidyl-prolyl cis-trans isomerase
MSRLLAFIFLAIACCGVWADTYKTPKGETDLKLQIESRGTVFIKLFRKEAPKTTDHIIQLVKDGFYDKQRFHRVDKSPKPYLVQIGDPSSRTGDLDNEKMGLGGSGTKVPYEDTGHQNGEGAVGLARLVENEDSGDSQFYILLGTSKFLDGHYTVFGQVVSGMDVVKKIERGDRVTAAAIIVG